MIWLTVITLLLFIVNSGEAGSLINNNSFVDNGTTVSTPEVVSLTDGRPLGMPPGTIVASANGAGNVDGTVKYCYTESDPYGETTCSSSITFVATNNKVRLTTPLPRRGVSDRTLYRTVSGGSTFYKLHQFGGAYFQTLWDDNVADAALTTPAPSADTTKLYKIATSSNFSVTYFRTHPSVSGPADLGILTADPYNNPSVYSADAYGPVNARAVGSGTPIQSVYTQQADGAGAGDLFGGYYVNELDDGVNAWTRVFRVQPKGLVTIQPLVNQQGLDITTSGIKAASFNVTLPAAPVANVQGITITATGAGSAAFEQVGVSGTLQAGYTGGSTTYGSYWQNSTASTGISYGTYGLANGNSAYSVGVGGFATVGSKPIGIYGSLGATPNTLTYPSGLAAAIVATNGLTTNDIIQGYDNTTAVFRVQDGGNMSLVAPGTSSTFTITATTGGASGIVRATGGTSIDIGSTNNVPIKFYANNVNVANFDVNGILRRGGTSRVSTQFDKTNDSTLANITGLTEPVAAGKTYNFRAVLHVTPDATGGHQYAIAGTATATAIVYQVRSLSNTTNLEVIASRQTALGGAVGQAGATSAQTIIEGTITVSVGGTLTVQFAQNVATPATTSSVLVGSTFFVEELS